MKRRLARLVLNCVGLYLTVSCRSSKDILDIKMPDTLAVGLPDLSFQLDWNKASDFGSSVLLVNVMEGLTGFDISGSEIRILPALAQQWDITEHGTRYTFKLRPSVKWSDGQMLKAADFIASMKRVLTPSTGSPWCDFLYIIKNAREFHDGKIKSFSQVGVRAIDDLTLVFDLNAPLTYFPEILAHYSTYPLRQDLIDKYKEAWSDPQNVVTLGPYRVLRAEKLRYVLMERYKDYYANKASIKKILLRFNVTPTLASELVRTGRLDVMTEMPPNPPKDLKRKREVLSSTLLGLTYVSFDVSQKPLSNPIFRRAIGMAIDRDELIRTTNTQGRATAGMIPPGLVGYESNRGIRFDPDTALKLLKHSGYNDMQKYSVELRVEPLSQNEPLAYNIQAQLKRNLGLDVKVVTDKPFNQKTYGNVPVMFLGRWQATVPDPDNFLKLFYGSSNLNITRWKNRNYDEFLRQAAATSVVEVRERLYSKAQHILTEQEMPVIPLFVNVQTLLVHKRLRGFPLNVLRLLPFKATFLEPE